MHHPRGHDVLRSFLLYFPIFWILPAVVTSWLALELFNFIQGWRHGGQHAAEVAIVNEAAITRTSLIEELRAQLWRNGETWSALAVGEQNARRAGALAQLIDNQLIAQSAVEHPDDPRTTRRESEGEFEQFLKQFPPPDEWKERMNLQGLDEPALRMKINQETKHRAAVENWLAQQPDRPTAADARRWFDAHQAELTVPERVRASHIFLTAHDENKPDREPEIRELHRQLAAGEATFEKLAATNSDDESAKHRAGDLGWFSRARVPPEFAEKVFSMPVGELSAPFESHLGWHILAVKEKQPQRPATFEETKDEIAAMLETRWREDAVRRLLADLRAKAKIEMFEAPIAKISPE